MLVTALASGRYDTLTGRWIGAKDNLDEMMRRIEEIQQDELYVWSFHRLKSEEYQR
jgi:hypothetical protein